MNLPLRGRGLNITEPLAEMKQRKDRIEMMNYQQKMMQQKQSIKILQEEEKYMN